MPAVMPCGSMCSTHSNTAPCSPNIPSQAAWGSAGPDWPNPHPAGPAVRPRRRRSPAFIYDTRSGCRKKLSFFKTPVNATARPLLGNPRSPFNRPIKTVGSFDLRSACAIDRHHYVCSRRAHFTHFANRAPLRASPRAQMITPPSEDPLMVNRDDTRPHLAVVLQRTRPRDRSLARVH
jgi:hypothetical protein